MEIQHSPLHHLLRCLRIIFWLLSYRVIVVPFCIRLHLRRFPVLALGYIFQLYQTIRTYISQRWTLLHYDIFLYFRCYEVMSILYLQLIYFLYMRPVMLNDSHLICLSFYRLWWMFFRIELRRLTSLRFSFSLLIRQHIKFSNV